MLGCRTAAGVFAFCALLCACGTTRAYDGPARTSDQVARVRCQQHGGDPLLRGLIGDINDAIGGYAPAERLDVLIESVDGRSVADEQVELLPGQHELTLSAHDPRGLIALGGVLRLEAVAGKEYAIDVVPGQKARQVFGVKEQGASTLLATSERAPEEYSPLAESDWLADFELADGTDTGRSVSVRWLPRGQSATEWKELLEVSRAPHAEPLTAFPNSPAWRERWQEESSQRFRERTLRANGKDWMSFGYSRTLASRDDACHGVGVWRVRGELEYLLCYERRGAQLTSAELDLWQKRLVDAPLR